MFHIPLKNHDTHTFRRKSGGYKMKDAQNYKRHLGRKRQKKSTKLTISTKSTKTTKLKKSIKLHKVLSGHLGKAHLELVGRAQRISSEASGFYNFSMVATRDVKICVKSSRSSALLFFFSHYNIESMKRDFFPENFNEDP